MSLKLTIVTQIEKVAREQRKTIAPLADNLPLLESGLDSLCFAILVARLEDEIGVDPFSAAPEAGFPTTFGEFVKFYENAVAAA
jgi:acyl carrier protein